MMTKGQNIVQLGPDDPFIHASPEDCLERFRRNETLHNDLCARRPVMFVPLNHRQRYVPLCWTREHVYWIHQQCVGCADHR
ncbi:hypothetical protein TNCV_3189381 [Trichonephila clavipes]|nr:hypothetical protein TNCV_3189381 [Trichonephila clavipes]